MHARLVSRLEAISGIELTPDMELSRLSTFRIGGRADLLASVRSESGLRALLAEVWGKEIGFHLVGLGSNVLFPDNGLEGLVVRLEGDFKKVRFDEQMVAAGAAVALPKLARRTAARGLSGLEALCGFPSTVGGAVVMNAGCYGTEIKDVMTTCRVVDEDGSVHELRVEDLQPGYRSTNLQESRRIVTSATFRLAAADASAVLARIDELNDARWDALPAGLPNVGSIFKNPVGQAAGRLIDECGLKGMTQGGARISPKHANVIVNAGGATASDVLQLMLAAFFAVRERFGVDLEPEVILAGGLRRFWEDSCRGAPQPV